MTKLTLNELTYNFKVKNKLTAISKKINDKLMFDKKLKKVLNTCFKLRQKTFNAVFFANVKTKLIHNRRHKLLLLKKENKVYLKLCKNYKLPRINNKKLLNQHCNSFLIKQRVERLTCKLELLSK